MLRASPTPPRLLHLLLRRPAAARPRQRQPPPFRRRKAHNNANNSSSSSHQQKPPKKKKEPYINRLLNTLSRTSRFILPRRLFSGPIARLRAAPASHLFSFLVLHELTAVLPIAGLMVTFRYFDIVPTSWVTGPWAAWALEGLGRYAGYVKRKGWFGLGNNEDGDEEKRLERELRRGEEERIAREEEAGGGKDKGGGGGVWGWITGAAGGKQQEANANENTEGRLEAEEVGETTAWQKVKSVITFGNVEEGYKTWIQLAAAYTITKLLLPVRIGVSLWATPYGARVITAFWKRVKGNKGVKGGR